MSAPAALRQSLRGLTFGAQLSRARRFPDNHTDPVELEADGLPHETAAGAAVLGHPARKRWRYLPTGRGGGEAACRRAG